MVDLLKAFGRGILYVLAFPFFIVVLAIFAVIGLLAFIFQLLKSIFFFFTGQKFFPELPEDKELRLKREAEEAKNNPAPQPAPTNESLYNEPLDEHDFKEEPTPIVSPVRENKPTPASVEEACFQDYPKEEPVKEETIVPEPEIEEEPVKEETHEPVLEESPFEGFLQEEENLDNISSAIEEEPAPIKEEENLDTYKPRGSDSLFEEDMDDTSTGIKINYED